MLQTSMRGGVAGAVATVVMTLSSPRQTPLRLQYDDVEILGKLVTRARRLATHRRARHVQNGAILGAAYARLKPSLPGPAVLRGLLAGLIEHVATWPLVAASEAVWRAITRAVATHTSAQSRHERMQRIISTTSGSARSASAHIVQAVAHSAQASTQRATASRSAAGRGCASTIADGHYVSPSAAPTDRNRTAQTELPIARLSLLES